MKDFLKCVLHTFILILVVIFSATIFFASLAFIAWSLIYLHFLNFILGLLFLSFAITILFYGVEYLVEYFL